MKSILATLVLIGLVSPAIPADHDLKLWYTSAAENWESQALPIGNGRLGGMIFGGAIEEHIQFNVDSLWTGNENPGGNYDHENFGNYQNFGDLFIHLGEGDIQDYRRELDLSTAIASVSYQKKSVIYHREIFCSHPDQIMAIRFTANKPRALTGTIRLADGRENTSIAQDDTVSFRGTLSNGMLYEARVKAIPEGGVLAVQDGQLRFTRCNAITLLLAADTNYKMDRAAQWRGEDPAARITKALSAAAKTPYNTLKSRHITDYKTLFDRVALDLGNAPAAARSLPTNERIKRYNETGDDRGLEQQLFQYGRYLLIGSSRPGTLPANLQGIWCNSNTPPWHSDYHSNINLQMNYWLAEVANLPELAQPLFDMLVAGTPVYHEHTVAKYGETQGYVTRMSINPFGGGGWNWNIEGTAWLAQHFWEHYAFSRNPTFLRETAWPWLRDVSLFWLDHLKELPDGQLVVPNVWSHEHGPYEDGTAHAQQLMWDLFNNTLSAAKILGEDPSLQKRLEKTIARLYGPQIGSWGQLMEWMGEKPELEKSNHRHTSHLFAVYPGRQISRERTPDLAAAGQLSLETRGSVGDSRRSWTWPWRTALWARFGEPEKCHEMIRGLFRHNMLENMITTHPPLQLDGSFGITAGMSEMLLQSQVQDPQTGTPLIELLPALPKAWANGSARGLRARGGYTVDLIWENGRLHAAKLTASVDGRCNLKYGNRTVPIMLRAGESKTLSANGS